MTTNDQGTDQQTLPDEVPTMTLAQPRAQRRDTSATSGDDERDWAEPSSEPTTRDVQASPFATDELDGLRARWNTVQAGFVDDPRECVQRADGLVSEVLGQLTQGFTDARSRLEEQWSRGEEASTEDLRVALTRYRDFFERLLAV